MQAYAQHEEHSVDVQNMLEEILLEALQAKAEAETNEAPDLSSVQIWLNVESNDPDDGVDGKLENMEMLNYWFEITEDSGDGIDNMRNGVFSDITVVKKVDATSPWWVNQAGNQNEFDKIEISVKHPDSHEFLRIVLVEPQIISLRHTTESENYTYEPSYPYELITLRSSEVFMVWQPLDDHGMPDGNPIISGWDIDESRELHHTAMPEHN